MKSKILHGLAAALAITASSITLSQASIQEITYGDVTGVVTDTAGKPLAGATVQLKRIDHGVAISEMATSDETGAFYLKSIVAASYSGAVRADGYADFGPFEAPVSQMMVLKIVVAMKTLQQAADESPGMTVIRTGAVSGAVVDKSGMPVIGATVELSRTSAGGMRILQVITTDAAGKFETERMFTANYAIIVRAPGYQDSEAVTVEVAEDKVTSVAISLLPL